MKGDNKQKVVMPMGGIDKSTKGTPQGIKQQTFKGSMDNLSHSISNGKAVQGRDKGGKADGFD